MSNSSAVGGWQLGYRPALDGLRGIAVLVVMLHHAKFSAFDYGGGKRGVTLFFVLSGFLITSLLAEEQRLRGEVDLLRFYERRALRLLPALVALVAVLYFGGAATASQAGWALSYVGNWNISVGGDLGYLGHTWSLAIEEQFYVAFPLLFIVLRRRPRALMAALLGGGALSVAWRIYQWSEGGPVYHGTFTRADAILFGCALGLAFSHGWIRRVPPVAGIAGCVGLVVVTASDPVTSFDLYGATLASVSSTVVVGAVISLRSGVVEGMLCWRPLRRAGRLSYGLYLWHAPVMWWSARGSLDLDGRWSTTAALMALSWVAAEGSMLVVERPFLRFKDRLPRAGLRPAPVSDAQHGPVAYVAPS